MTLVTRTSATGSDRPSLTRRQLLTAVLAGSAGMPLRAQTPEHLIAATHDFRTGMYVVITGSGAALPVPERGNASAAVVIDGTVLQFDCGRRVMDNLMLAGINPATVDYFFFTHLHFDHISEYGYYVVTSWLAGRQKPFQVFGPQGTVDMSEGAIRGMHKTDVEFVTARRAGRGGAPLKVAPQAPVQVRDVGPGVIIETKDFKVTAVDSIHLEMLGPHRSLAYRVDCPHGSVVVSGDTGPSDEVIQLATDTDVLIHECTNPPAGFLGGGTFNRTSESAKAPNTGHTTPAELGQVARRARVKKLVATHFGPYTRVQAGVEMSSQFFGSKMIGPEVWPAIAADIKRSYEGPVILAEDALVIRIA